MFENVPHHHRVEMLVGKIHFEQFAGFHGKAKNVARIRCRIVIEFCSLHVPTALFELILQQTATAANIEHPAFAPVVESFHLFCA